MPKININGLDGKKCSACPQGLRIWLIKAEKTSVKILDCASMETLFPHSPPDFRICQKTVVCAAVQREKNLLSCTPGIYPPPENGEEISFFQKLSAWMDEAIWGDRFDIAFLHAEKVTGKILLENFSLPLLARIVIPERRTPQHNTALSKSSQRLEKA